MSEHVLTPESEALIQELVDGLGHAIGISGARSLVIDRLHDIERAAAERARLGHIREWLESDEFDALGCEVITKAPDEPVHDARPIWLRIRDAWLARHPEAKR